MYLPKFSACKFFLCLFVFISSFNVAIAADHPHLFFTADDIDGLRERAFNSPVAKEAFRKISSDVNLDYRIKYPSLDSSMRDKWQYLTIRIAKFSSQAAFSWVVTQDRKYLEQAKYILLEAAENFDQKINFHRFSDKEYMRIYFTGRLGVGTAWAYDMIYNELTAAERKLIEDKLLRGIVEMVKNSAKNPPSKGNAMVVNDFEWGPGQWNGVMYCNAGIAAIGFALGDEEIIEHAVDNYRTYIARDILSDGLFHEEDWAYATFCMASMVAIAEMAHNSGYHQDLYNTRFASKPFDQWDSNYGEAFAPEGEDKPTRGLRDYFEAIVDCQYPNLSGNNLGWQKNWGSFSAGPQVTMFELGWRRFEGHPFGWILDNMKRNRGDNYCFMGTSPVLFGDQPIENKTKPETHSRVFNHGGWLVLKSIEGEDYWGSDSIFAFMPYGNSRSKGLQRLSLDIFAYGRCLSPRVAKYSRHQSHDHGWYNFQPAWNNLMVDGQNMTGRRTDIESAKMRYSDLDSEKPFKIAQGVMEVQYKERPSIWDDEISMRREDFDYEKGRTLAMTSDYLLDISHVKHHQPQKIMHNFHLNIHGTGEMELIGAKHDQRVKHPVSAIWRYEDNVGLKSTVLIGDEDQGNIIYQYTTPDSSFMQVMRCGFNTLIAAVHEPFKNQPEIDKISQLWLDGFAIAVNIVDNEKFNDIHFFNAVNDSIEARGEKFTLSASGPYVFIRLADGVLNVYGQVNSFSFDADFFDVEVKNVIINSKQSANALTPGGGILWLNK